MKKYILIIFFGYIINCTKITNLSGIYGDYTNDDDQYYCLIEFKKNNFAVMTINFVGHRLSMSLSYKIEDKKIIFSDGKKEYIGEFENNQIKFFDTILPKVIRKLTKEEEKKIKKKLEE